MKTIKFPGTKPIAIASILYIAGDGNYSDIHRTNGPKISVTLPLKSIEALVPGLLRIHKRFIVNPAHVLQGDLGNYRHPGEVTVKGGASFPVAKRRHRFVCEHLSKRNVS